MGKESYRFLPLMPERWGDFERLFGEKGACGGCWCMWWRSQKKQFASQKGERNRLEMKKIVDSGEVPGIIAYSGDDPVGWCSLGPREKFIGLQNSKILKSIDDRPVWSIVCFFIDKNLRKQGLHVVLVKAALDYAKNQGAEIVEAYPIDPGKPDYPPIFAWTGFYSSFIKAGFKEVARRSPKRPIVRYYFD